MSSLRENVHFLEVFLCLSRACLGKMFVFMHQWLKKTVVTHHPLSEGSRGSPPSRAGAISSTSSSPSTAVSQGTNSTAASHPPSLSLPATTDDDTGVAPAAADTFPIEIKHVVQTGASFNAEICFPCVIQCNSQQAAHRWMQLPPAEKNTSFVSTFPSYVCPEPVLVN